MQWKKDNVAIAGATNLDYRASQTGSYAAEITSEGGCKAISVPIQVIIGTPMSSLGSVNDKNDFCKTFSMSLNNTYYGQQDLLKAYDYRFQWLRDGNEIKNATDSYYNATEGGKYQLKVEQGNCVAFSKTV